MNDWKQRHAEAMLNPVGSEEPFIIMFNGWKNYASWHKERYGTPIGDDFYVGEVWEAIGAALRDLLSTDLGRLDCGTLDKLICDTITENGGKVPE